MIDFIEGTVESKAPGELVISAGGVGFLLMCSNTTLAEAPAKGEKWRCHTVLNVREDAMELFGFATRQERAMFKRLCQVTGVGAKTALGVLSALPLRDLSVAIVTGDVAALSRAPGGCTGGDDRRCAERSAGGASGAGLYRGGGGACHQSGARSGGYGGSADHAGAASDRLAVSEGEDIC